MDVKHFSVLARIVCYNCGYNEPDAIVKLPFRKYRDKLHGLLYAC
jgi:hypothetical protein